MKLASHPTRCAAAFVVWRRQAVSALTLAWVVAISLSDAAAQSRVNAGAAASSPAGASEIRAWLLRIHDAANHRNFRGTFVVSGGGVVASARIAHYVDGADQYERSESLDGPPRFVYRHNDQVHTVWPVARVSMIEQRSMVAAFPALLQAADDRIADFYDVHGEGVERVAGHEANVLRVTPKDGMRYGYRLWADQASGLLLRADVLGERGEVLETSAFSEVTIGVKAQPQSVLLPMKRLDSHRVLRPQLTPTRLDLEGWTMRQPAPGFRPVSCVRRPMQGTVAPEREGPQAPALHVIYSDGLTYVSVFIEPFDARRHSRPMLAAVGATQTLMIQHGEWWVTVVGDVPAATLRWFAKGLELAQK